MEAVCAPGGRTPEDDEGALTAPTGGVPALLAALTARCRHDPVVAERLVDLARRIVARLKLDAAEVSVVTRVALVHDVGRIGMPDSLLDKQGELDERERAGELRETRRAGTAKPGKPPPLRPTPCS